MAGGCGASNTICGVDKPMCINGVCSEYAPQPFPSIPSLVLTPLEKYHLQPIADSCVFNPTCYADNYPDLKNTFGYNLSALTNHWNTYRVSDGGRNPCCQAPVETAVAIYRKYNTDPVTARYIRVRPAKRGVINATTDEFMNISQIAVYGEPTIGRDGLYTTTANLAKGKPVTASTVTGANGPTWTLTPVGPLSNVTDGTMAPRESVAGGAWHSNRGTQGPNPNDSSYLEIDLGSSQKLYNFIFYGSETTAKFTGLNRVYGMRIQALDSNRTVVSEVTLYSTNPVQNRRFIKSLGTYETDFTKVSMPGFQGKLTPLTQAQALEAYKEIVKNNLLNMQYDGILSADEVIRRLKDVANATRPDEIPAFSAHLYICILHEGIARFTAILMNASKSKTGDTTPSDSPQVWSSRSAVTSGNLPTPVVPSTNNLRGSAITVSRLDDGSTNDALARSRGSGFLTIPKADLDPNKLLGDNTTADPYGTSTSSGIYGNSPTDAGYRRPNSTQGCPPRTTEKTCSDPSGRSKPRPVCLAEGVSCDYQCVDANGNPSGVEPITCAGTAVIHTCPPNSSYSPGPQSALPSSGSSLAGCYSLCPENTQAIGDKCYPCPFGTEYVENGYGLSKYRGQCVFKCNGAAMNFKPSASLLSAQSYDIVCGGDTPATAACPAFMTPFVPDANGKGQCITMCPTGYDDIAIDIAPIKAISGIFSQTVFMGTDNENTVDGKINGCWAAIDSSVAQSPYVTIRPPIRFNICPEGYEYLKGGLGFTLDGAGAKSIMGQSSMVNLGKYFTINKMGGGYSADQFVTDMNPADIYRFAYVMTFYRALSTILNPPRGCFRFNSGDVTTGGDQFNLPYTRKDLLFSGTTQIVAKTAQLLELTGLSDTNPAHIIHQAYYNSLNARYADESTNPANIMKNSKIVVCPEKTYPVIPVNRESPMYCSSDEPTSMLAVNIITYPILSFTKSEILGTRPYLYVTFNKFIAANPPSKIIKVSLRKESLRTPLAIIDFPTYSTDIYGKDTDLFTKPVSWALAVPKYKGPKGSWTTETSIFNTIIGLTNASIGATASESTVNQLVSQGWSRELAVSLGGVTSAMAQQGGAAGLNQFQRDMAILYKGFPVSGFTAPTRAITTRSYVSRSTTTTTDVQTPMCQASCSDYGCPPEDGTVPSDCSDGTTRCIQPGTMC